MLPGILRAASSGTEPIAISLTDNTFSASAATSFSFTGRSVGAAASDRDIVIVCAFRGNSSTPSVSSITIAGNAATIESSNGATATGVVIARYRLTAGTTADIVANMSASTSHCGIAVFRMTGASTAAPTNSTSTSTTAPVTLNISVAAGGGAVGGNYADRISVSDIGWSAGLTENAEHALSSGFVHASYGSGTFASAVTSQAFTATRTESGAGGNFVSVAVYAPA